MWYALLFQPTRETAVLGNRNMEWAVFLKRERKDWTVPVSCLTIILLSLVGPYNPLFGLLVLTAISNMSQQQGLLAFPAASSLMAWNIMLLHSRVKLTWISLLQTHPWVTIIETGSVSLFLHITQGLVANFAYQLLEQGSPFPPNLHMVLACQSISQTFGFTHAEDTTTMQPTVRAIRMNIIDVKNIMITPLIVESSNAQSTTFSPAFSLSSQSWSFVGSSCSSTTTRKTEVQWLTVRDNLGLIFASSPKDIWLLRSQISLGALYSIALLRHTSNETNHISRKIHHIEHIIQDMSKDLKSMIRKSPPLQYLQQPETV